MLRHVWTLIAIMMVFTMVTAEAREAGITDFDKAVGDLIPLLGKLQQYGWNVSSYIEELNSIIAIASKGEIDAALNALKELKHRVLKDVVELERQLPFIEISKYTSIALILSIPVITYFALPRVYLLLWYRSRRKWEIMVRDKGEKE